MMLAPHLCTGLRGLASMDTPISPDDLLISVPRELAITLAPKQPCPFPELVPNEAWREVRWGGVRVALPRWHVRL